MVPKQTGTSAAPSDLDPGWQWNRRIPFFGHTAVDFERRRLRRYRLARAKMALENSGCGALLLFDVNNIRYVTGTKIGEWERDKMHRFALLAGDAAPCVWDFGSAAPHSKSPRPPRPVPKKTPRKGVIIGCLLTISPTITES